MGLIYYYYNVFGCVVAEDVTLTVFMLLLALNSTPVMQYNY